MAAARVLRYKRRVPKRETRHSIEQALAGQRHKRQLARAEIERQIASIEEHLARMRRILDPAGLARMEMRFRDGGRRIPIGPKSRRRPGDGSMPALVEPPRGPKPFAGGAAAPLEFD